MSDDTKADTIFVVDSSQLNGQPTRVYSSEPKWLAGAVAWKRVIELEPTLQLMKEMGEALTIVNKKLDEIFKDNGGK